MIGIIGLLLLITTGSMSGQSFVHPGIDMNRKDLEYMKKQTLAGQEPWKSAYDRLKAKTSTDFEVAPVTHVIRGPYGRPDVGASALMNNSDALYDCALLWYISGEEVYAKKAMEIIEKWSGRVWSFDDNDAKLLGGLTCHPLCAGAEILRYHYNGWTAKHTEQFSRMLMETYYPLLRFYFPEANGNWDGVITRALMSMAVFMDNRALFDGAVDHFLHAPANGSLFKYVYPSGQCQETSRDLAHIQMGLLEFGGAARVAYTQGVDLLSLGNNRLALGLEYTMDIIFGGSPQSYGVFSVRAIDNRRDDYEYFYRHYKAKGLKTPLLERMAGEVRDNAGRGVLIGFREEFQNKPEVQPAIAVLPCQIAYPAGATDQELTPTLANDSKMIEVNPGDDLQAALDQASGTKNIVFAKPGIHMLKQTLRIPSDIRLYGAGLKTVLLCDGAGYYALAPKDSSSMQNVTIANLIVEGATTHEIPSDPNTGRFNRSGRFANSLTGIAFLGVAPGSMKNITLENVTVIHFSRNGVLITGAAGLQIKNCNFSDNGAQTVPGPRLQHNLLIRHVDGADIVDSRFDTSIAGCGIALDNCSNINITRCEIARNAWQGVLVSTSEKITIAGCLIEGNNACGIMSEYLYSGNRNLKINDNIIQYNNGYGVEAFRTEQISLSGNKYDLNGRTPKQENISNEPQIILN